MQGEHKDKDWLRDIPMFLLPQPNEPFLLPLLFLHLHPLLFFFLLLSSSFETGINHSVA